MDYYGLLGVSRNATEKEIKEAFRKKALIYHPDKQHQKLKEQATAKFQEICEAYKVLSNMNERMVYDRSDRSGVNRARTKRYQNEDMRDFHRYREQYQRQQQYYYKYHHSYHSYDKYYFKGFMSWREFSFRYGKILAFQTIAATMFVSFVIIVDSGANEAWKTHNRGKSFEDMINLTFQRMKSDKEKNSKSND